MVSQTGSQNQAGKAMDYDSQDTAEVPGAHGRRSVPTACNVTGPLQNVGQA